jgi:CheY-like chemotaxis protein
MIQALVIDDARETADSLCQMLSLLNVTAIPAYSPRAAILFLRDSLPDIIFLDINMPGLSGFEMLGYLRREPGLSDIPVCVITSDDQQVTIDQAQKDGALSVLIKPLTFETLEGALRLANLIE